MLRTSVPTPPALQSGSRQISQRVAAAGYHVMSAGKTGLEAKDTYRQPHQVMGQPPCTRRSAAGPLVITLR